MRASIHRPHSGRVVTVVCLPYRVIAGSIPSLSMWTLCASFVAWFLFSTRGQMTQSISLIGHFQLTIGVTVKVMPVGLYTWPSDGLAKCTGWTPPSLMTAGIGSSLVPTALKGIKQQRKLACTAKDILYTTLHSYFLQIKLYFCLQPGWLWMQLYISWPWVCLFFY